MTQPKDPQFRFSKSKFFSNNNSLPKHDENLGHCKVKFEGLDVFLYAWQVQYILDTGISFEIENKTLKEKLAEVEAQNKRLRDALEFYANDSNWYNVNKEPGLPVLKMVIASLDTENNDWVGGKRAREALKSEER